MLRFQRTDKIVIKKAFAPYEQRLARNNSLRSVDVIKDITFYKQ